MLPDYQMSSSGLCVCVRARVRLRMRACVRGEDHVRVLFQDKYCACQVGIPSVSSAFPARGTSSCSQGGSVPRTPRLGGDLARSPGSCSLGVSAERASTAVNRGRPDRSPGPGAPGPGAARQPS